MIRKIISIDEDKCNGCGDCVPSCAEGALQIINGKARLISDLFCDGLGACLGTCPTNAITVIEREAEPYNERKVMEYIIKGGKETIVAHIKHLIEHGENEYANEAFRFLKENGIPNPFDEISELAPKQHSGCPGSKALSFETKENQDESPEVESQLTHWPIQLHLVSPEAPYYRNSDVLIAADCCAYSYGNFHADFMKGKSVAIACPKLDTNKEIYLDKIVTMINKSEVKSITVAIMQVPCCGGLVQLVQQALNFSERDVPVNVVVIGVRGEILQEVSIN
ncbi:MAG: 4Fe-4S binding protein [Ignavibacteriaceae bacterium]|nr:4Fe-4S binding protein [Ignavibacteriaceae bacterium]